MPPSSLFHLPAVGDWRFWSESGWAKSTNGYVGHLCICKPGYVTFPGWSGNETGPALVTFYLQPSSSLCWCLMTSATSQQSQKPSCRTSTTIVNTLPTLSLLYSTFSLTCREVIAVNQDKLGVQGRLIGSSFVSYSLSLTCIPLKVLC